MPVPKQRIPKWAYVEESRRPYIDYCYVDDMIETLSAFPGDATFVVIDDHGYPEVRIEWRRVMTDEEYDKEYAKRKAQREREQERKERESAEYTARIKAEAERLGLIDVE